MKTKSFDLKSMVAAAFFAAVVYLGIQTFRIPLPAAVGTPFLHFGHIFVMLAVLCLGPVNSAIAGTVGLVLFDVLNGYIQAIPNVFITTVIKCLLAGTVYLHLKSRANGDRHKKYRAAVLCAALYGVTNIILDFIFSVMELLIAGSGFQAALAAELTSIPATIINAGFTVVGIAVFCVPVLTAYEKINTPVSGKMQHNA